MDEELTLAEAEARTGIDTSTWRHWIADGKVKARKRGRDWFVAAADVEAIAASGVKPRRPHKKRRREGDGADAE